MISLHSGPCMEPLSARGGNLGFGCMSEEIVNENMNAVSKLLLRR